MRGKKAQNAARDSYASSLWSSEARLAEFFRHRRRGSCSMRRAERTGLGTIQFFSLPCSEKHLRKPLAKKKISTVTAERLFAERSISFYLTVKSFQFTKQSKNWTSKPNMP